VPSRPKRSAPDCQLSARDREVLKSWQTGAWGESQSGLWSGRPTRPSSLPPQPARPEARTARPPRPDEPRPRQLRFASFGVCHEGCVRLSATRAVIYSAAKTAPAPANAGPPVLAALKITASCGQRPWPACHAHCLRPAALNPAPPPATQCSRQAGLASFTPAPHSAPLISYARAETTKRALRATRLGGG